MCKVKEQYPITLLQLKNGQSVLSTNFRENNFIFNGTIYNDVFNTVLDIENFTENVRNAVINDLKKLLYENK